MFLSISYTLSHLFIIYDIMYFKDELKHKGNKPAAAINDFAFE